MSIAGTWWNELGSKVVIKRDRKDKRLITGKYHTNVGDAKARIYPLVGRCDASGNPDQLVSWVVVWDPPDPPPNPSDPPNKPSITAWAGQYHADKQTGLEFITTTWLLTSMSNAADDWKSTRVSMDVFFRTPPTPKMTSTAKRMGKAASLFSDPVAKQNGPKKKP